MGTKQPYGWDEAGNCLWCGEAGRCQCDHSRQVEASARRMRSHAYLLAACKALMAQRIMRHDGIALVPIKALESIAYAIAKAEGQDGAA